MPSRVRRRSARRIWGMPLWSIAIGPNRRKGEMFGHAKGFFAIGDVATGIFALGGTSIGVFSLGGISLGVFTVGGVAVGLGFALGGVALALLGFAFGGVAVGIAAYGGVAVGIWGKGAAGAWVYSIWAETNGITSSLTRWLC